MGVFVAVPTISLFVIGFIYAVWKKGAACWHALLELR
jgi:hypothetical protein